MENQLCHFSLSLCILNLFDDTNLSSNWYACVCVWGGLENVMRPDFIEFILHDSICFRSFPIFKVMWLSGFFAINIWFPYDQILGVQLLFKDQGVFGVPRYPKVNVWLWRNHSLTLSLMMHGQWRERLTSDLREDHTVYTVSEVMQSWLRSSFWTRLLKEHLNMRLGQNLFLEFSFVKITYLYVHWCECIRSPGTEVINSHELPCGCWELNLRNWTGRAASAFNDRVISLDLFP